MAESLEVPRIADLDLIQVEVEMHAEPGVVSVTAAAGNGDSVRLTWDEIAGSVSVRWTEGGHERLVLERESAARVSIREEEQQIEFLIWFRSGDLDGKMVVRVSEWVGVSDTCLRV